MSAVFSPCGLYRLRLDRDLCRKGPTVCIIGVNPSTAGAVENDATIRREIGFASRFGWGRLIKGNKFAYCATDVRALRGCADPIGSENDRFLAGMMREADLVVVAWGTLRKLPRSLQARWRDVVAIARQSDKALHCLGVVRDGHPRHPLMLAGDAPLVAWSPPDVHS